MFWTVVRIEWLGARRERGLWVMLAMFSLFIAFAAFGSHQLVQSERVHLERAAEQESALLTQLAERARTIEARTSSQRSEDSTDPHRVGRDLLPRVASLPLAPLAPLARGKRDLLPQTVLLTTRSRLAALSDSEAESPAQRSSGPFDLAFVLGFLLPLLVIANTFDLLAGERERGTLSLVLSQPISLSTFVFGKAALRALVLVGVTIVVTSLGAVLAGARIGAPGGATAFALFVGLVVAYTLFWFGLSLAVNAFGRGSAANALALVGLWLSIVVVVPGLASVAVDTVYPSPSRISLVNVAREAAQTASSEASQLEGNHGQPEGNPASEKRALEVQADLERRLEPVLQDFDSRLLQQQSLVDSLRFLSPMLLLNEGLTDLAGSGSVRYEHFDQQVESFHVEHKQFFHARVETDQPLRSADYVTMPRFNYAELPASAVAGRVLPAIATLIAMTALLLGATQLGLRKHFARGLR